MSPDNIDEEGWSYAVNFGEFRDLESGQFEDLNIQIIDVVVVVVDDDDDDDNDDSIDDNHDDAGVRSLV